MGSAPFKILCAEFDSHTFQQRKNVRGNQAMKKVR